MSKLPSRQMQLSERHVALVRRDIPDPGPQLIAGFRTAIDADDAENVARMLATRPPGPFWLFGISSLIWRPETAFTERRVATAQGWHRRFCLGVGLPVSRHTRSAWPDDGARSGRAVHRRGLCLAGRRIEVGTRQANSTRDEHGPICLSLALHRDENCGRGSSRIGLPVNRKSGRYIAGLSDDQLADILATACGFRGPMAEYLFQTVSMLEQLGIHDRNLWSLQAKVAARIDVAHARS